MTGFTSHVSYAPQSIRRCENCGRPSNSELSGIVVNNEEAAFCSRNCYWVCRIQLNSEIERSSGLGTFNLTPSCSLSHVLLQSATIDSAKSRARRKKRLARAKSQSRVRARTSHVDTSGAHGSGESSTTANTRDSEEDSSDAPLADLAFCLSGLT